MYCGNGEKSELRGCPCISGPVNFRHLVRCKTSSVKYKNRIGLASFLLLLGFSRFVRSDHSLSKSDVHYTDFGLRLRALIFIAKSISVIAFVLNVESTCFRAYKISYDFFSDTLVLALAEPSKTCLHENCDFVNLGPDLKQTR